MKTDYITALVAQSIRAYPMLYPNRLAVLQSMFATTNFFVNDKGEMEHCGTPMEPFQPEQRKSESTIDVFEHKKELVHEMEQQRLKFISDNADRFAETSIYDTIESINTIRLPMNRAGETVAYEDLDKITQDAFVELVDAYESEFSTTEHQDKPAISASISSKSWNLRRVYIARAFDGALDFKEQITGKTREERAEDARALTESLMKGLLIGGADE